MDFRETNRQIIAQFRDSAGVGRLGPIDFERLVLITTKGRRTGRPHTVPLGSVRDEAGNIVLFASNMGAPAEPQWFANLAADPTVTAEITGTTWTTTAIIPTGAQRELPTTCG